MSPPPIPETLRSHFPFQEKGNIFSFPKFLGIGIPSFPATVTTTGSRKGSLIFGGNSFQKALPHREKSLFLVKPNPIFPTDALCRSVGNWALGQDDDDVVSPFVWGLLSSWSSFTGWSGPCAGFPGGFSGKNPARDPRTDGIPRRVCFKGSGFEWDCRAAV